MATVDVLGHMVEVELDDRGIMRGVLEMIRDIQAQADYEGKLKIDPINPTLEVLDILDRADALLKEILSPEDIAKVYGGRKRPINEPLAAMMVLGGHLGESYDKSFEQYLPADVRETTE